jgi:hypothetical protein
MSELPPQRAAITLACVAIIAPPVAWMIANFAGGWSGGAVRSEWAEPVVMLLTLAALSAVFCAVALALRRRTLDELAWLVAIVQFSGVAALLLAIAAPLAMPTGGGMVWEPTPVLDRTAFARAFYSMHHASPGAVEYVKRESWAVDEYGIVPPNIQSTGYTWIGYWEEYGLPFRCVRSPMHFGVPRPKRTEYLSRTGEIFRQMRLLPVPLAADTAIIAAIVVAILHLPGWIIARRRSQSDCCPKCGYFVRDLPRCSECGAHVRRHRRGVSVVRD